MRLVVAPAVIATGLLLLEYETTGAVPLADYAGVSDLAAPGR